MFDWRTLALGGAVFGATFAGSWWWMNAGKPTFGIGLPAAQAAVPLAWSGPGIHDETARKVLVLRAKAYLQPTCNSDPKTLYVKAVSKYAEQLMGSAGCNNYPKCPMGEGQLNQVWRLNRSALDQPVALAMAEVMAAGGLTERDFRGDVGRAVRVIAGADFASGPGPECADPNSGRVRRIRIRR